MALTVEHLRTRLATELANREWQAGRGKYVAKGPKSGGSGFSLGDDSRITRRSLLLRPILRTVHSLDFVVYKSIMFATFCQTSTSPFPFWSETFSIFVGDVLATLFVGGGAYILWYIVKYPGFRVGANWTFIGWDFRKMGRLPNDTDTGDLELMPNVSVTSRDMSVKKVITAVWVRERADVNDPGQIHGVLHLNQTGMHVDSRTTGGDLLSFPGPKIACQMKEFQSIFNCPIFIQTSDGEFYQAESPGNMPKGVAKFRYKVQKIVYAAKQRLLRKLQ